MRKQRKNRSYCNYPGCEGLKRITRHHIIPKNEGGPNIIDNYIYLCNEHHNKADLGLRGFERTYLYILSAEVRKNKQS